MQQNKIQKQKIKTTTQIEQHCSSSSNNNNKNNNTKNIKITPTETTIKNHNTKQTI
jgi:hypothetical protein